MSSQEIRAAAIEVIEAAIRRRMILIIGRQLYARSAAQNRSQLNSSVVSSNSVHGGEQDANDEASANSNEEEMKETVTPPSSTDQQTADGSSVIWELLDPETGKRRNFKICSSSSPSAGASAIPSSVSSASPSSGPSSVSSAGTSYSLSSSPSAAPWQPPATTRSGLHHAMVSGLLDKRRKFEQQKTAQIRANEARSRGLVRLGLPGPFASKTA